MVASAKREPREPEARVWLQARSAIGTDGYKLDPSRFIINPGWSKLDQSGFRIDPGEYKLEQSGS